MGASQLVLVRVLISSYVLLFNNKFNGMFDTGSWDFDEMNGKLQVLKASNTSETKEWLLKDGTLMKLFQVCKDIID